MDYAAQYGKMHESQKRFPGYSLGAYTGEIAKLVEKHRPDRLLDYGSGKGYQYLARRYHERWGGLLPHCYDIGVQQLAEKPEGDFGGVICTDMLEHIEAGDLERILDELIGYTAQFGFLFLGISCRPTRKKLPDGRDPHVTVWPPARWAAAIDDRLGAADRRGQIHVRAEFDLGDPVHFVGETQTDWESPIG